MGKAVRLLNSATPRLVLFATLLAGCHHAGNSTELAATPTAENSPVTGAPVGQRAFGDSVAHAVRVLAFDTKSEQASVYVREPDNVLVLAVLPGRDIEVIFPGGMNVKRLGANNFVFDMQRVELAKREVASEAATNREAFAACMQRQAAYRRELQNIEKARRDSTGKVVRSAPTYIPPEPPPCDLLGDPKTQKTRLVEKALPPREPAERYLVVMSSSSPVSAAELETRLATLSVNASDVSLTIEGIAAGIYAGKSGTWGGTFVSW